MESTHREAWAGALLCFTLFIALFVITEIGDGPSLFHFLRLVMLAVAGVLFCIGWMMREREKDEPVFDLILSEREQRLRDGHRDAA